MSFLKNFFGVKEKPIESYQQFWEWFQKNQSSFFRAILSGNDIEEKFLDKVSPKLNQLREGFYFLTGMYNDDTVELIITVDGSVKDFVFVEELVDAAPQISGWKFTAHKPALEITDVEIAMSGYEYSANNLSFYSNDSTEFPDEIDITVVYKHYNETDKGIISNGVFVFLDNYLGELNAATIIDKVEIIGKNESGKELIPFEKLRSFITWREKEFIERYEGIRHNTDSDTYAGFEATLENGKPLLAVMNTDLLNWNSKASHPWILHVEIKYDGTINNGMPDEITYHQLEEIENQIAEKLKDYEGYLNVGRQTADGCRDIYFACKDFRKPSKVVSEIVESYSGNLEIIYDIYKDKYWQTFRRFQV